MGNAGPTHTPTNLPTSGGSQGGGHCLHLKGGATAWLAGMHPVQRCVSSQRRHVLSTGRGLSPLGVPHVSPVLPPAPTVRPGRTWTWVRRELASGSKVRGGEEAPPTSSVLSASQPGSGRGTRGPRPRGPRPRLSLGQRRPVRGWPEPGWETRPVAGPARPLAHQTAGGQGLPLGPPPPPWPNHQGAESKIRAHNNRGPRVTAHSGSTQDCESSPKLQVKPPVSCGG